MELKAVCDSTSHVPTKPALSTWVMLAHVTRITISYVPGVFKSGNNRTTEFWSLKDLGDAGITEQILARLGLRGSERIQNRLAYTVLELEEVIESTHFTDVEAEPQKVGVAFLVPRTPGSPFMNRASGS